MSYAKLNIWLRHSDCSLIKDCWRTDLVIKTCGGTPLVDMDSTVIEKLRARYPDYATVEVPEGLYYGERRIRITPTGWGSGDYFSHIEVDAPPGCYVVWTRICYSGNEETNKVMVIVGCGDEACVNLLLNPLETCSNELFHPFLEHAAGLRLPKRELQIVAKVFMAVMEKPKKEVVRELDQRHQDAVGMKDSGLQKAIGTVMEIVKAMPAGDDKE